MGSDHDDALKEFLSAMDKRLETAPLVDRRELDRRAQPGDKPSMAGGRKALPKTPSPIGIRRPIRKD